MTPAELRTWRERHGMSQLQLAAALGVTPSSIHRWEAGTTGIPPYLALALATLARRRRKRA